MYYEEEFYAAANNNNVDHFDKNKDVLDDIKKNDKGYRKIKQTLNKEFNGKYYKKVTIELYISGDTGSSIRDAVSGRYMQHRVGTKEEDLYFKVHVDYTISGISQGSAFYSSPEEYEKHQFVLLPTTIKERWYQKNFVARKAIE